MYHLDWLIIKKCLQKKIIRNPKLSRNQSRKKKKSKQNFSPSKLSNKRNLLSSPDQNSLAMALMLFMASPMKAIGNLETEKLQTNFSSLHGTSMASDQFWEKKT